jgi:hypothetical protein
MLEDEEMETNGEDQGTPSTTASSSEFDSDDDDSSSSSEDGPCPAPPQGSQPFLTRTAIQVEVCIIYIIKYPLAGPIRRLKNLILTFNAAHL